MAVHAALLVVELRLPAARSLKDKRAVVRSILDGARRRFAVATAETDDHDIWQHAELAFSAVSSSAGHTVAVLDEVERFVWSFPEVEVVDTARRWTEMD
jgi:uncharacterized protein YlxP (DUF503 family)